MQCLCSVVTVGEVDAPGEHLVEEEKAEAVEVLGGAEAEPLVAGLVHPVVYLAQHSRAHHRPRPLIRRVVHDPARLPDNKTLRKSVSSVIGF